MKIEILKPGNMVQKGSALMKLLMNDHTPVLDLLVRESIQNSLDAAAEKNNLELPVAVHFQVGSFNSSALNECLEGVSDRLNKKFPNDDDSKYKFLSISDKGTQGLTGPLNIEDVTGDKLGNLIKLVYDICKPQDESGSGGSWGIGKTIYFRIGIGLVIYYSRIYDERTCKYKSRLVASLVEDESSPNAVIPQYQEFPKYGIAWWGDEIRDNKTVPITDENYIRDFLSIFNIKEYQGSATGTTIIIPYINETRLLNNNALNWEGQRDDFSPYWINSLEGYLRIAVQRWYFPRLDNKSYKQGKRLKVKINNTAVAFDSFLRLYQIEQSLYNRASGENKSDDILYDCDVKTEEIKLRSVLKDPMAGRVSFVKVTREFVGMCPPDNDYHPNINLNIPIKDSTKNYPVMAYCRKPGMIVAYDQDSWVRSVPPCSSDEFVLSVFVLNSDNILSTGGISLEEYIRKGEHADHAAWNDSTIGTANPFIVQKIQKNASDKIASLFAEDDDDSPRRNSGLGKLLGDLILPPVGFGTQSTNRPRTGTSGGTSSGKNVRYKLSGIEYDAENVSIKYNISANDAAKQFGLDSYISSESSSISFDSWEKELGLKLPFEIISINIKINKIDRDKCYNTYLLDTTKDETDELLSIRLNKSKRGSCCGMCVNFHEKHSFDANVTINMVLNKRDVRPVIKPL